VLNVRLTFIYSSPDSGLSFTRLTIRRQMVVSVALHSRLTYCVLFVLFCSFLTTRAPFLIKYFMFF